MIRVRAAFYLQNEYRCSFLAADQWTDSFCSSENYYHARHIQELCNCRIQNPDIQRAGRVGAHGGAAGRGRAEQFAQETSDPRTLQGIEETSPERLP